MDINELDLYLRKLNTFEEKILSIDNNYALKNKEEKKKLLYSQEVKNNKWIINSDVFLKDDENIGIHKHDRFMRFEEHGHDYLEMIYIYDGKLHHKIGQADVELKKGELLILDLNVSHSIEPAEINDIAVNILIKKEFFDWIIMGQLADNDIISDFVVKTIYDRQIYKSYLHFQCGDHMRIQNVMHNLLCEFYDPTFCTETVIHSYMMILFTELLRFQKKNLSKMTNKRFNTAIGSEIIRYIQKEYRQLSMRDLANHFNFNCDYLGKIIKQTTGKTFTDLLQEIRLNEACILLKNSQVSVSDIIKEVGYSNKSYFYKIFKKNFQLTPDEYRSKVGRS